MSSDRLILGFVAAGSKRRNRKSAAGEATSAVAPKEALVTEAAAEVHPFEFLRAHRKRLGLTQHQVARALGIPRGTLACWELGVRPVHLEHLKRLAALYGVSVSQLLAEPDTSQVGRMRETFSGLNRENRERAIRQMEAMLRAQQAELAAVQRRAAKGASADAPPSAADADKDEAA